jgi:hypothetical protein
MTTKPIAQNVFQLQRQYAKSVTRGKTCSLFRTSKKNWTQIWLTKDGKGPEEP